jgi:hypothetical protein
LWGLFRRCYEFDIFDMDGSGDVCPNGIGTW